MAERSTSTGWQTPTGKYTLGRIPTDNINYFGSVNFKLIEENFIRQQRQSFSIHREILWESDLATASEVAVNEIEFIRAFKSNDPAIGYNRWPKLKTGSSSDPEGD